MAHPLDEALRVLDVRRLVLSVHDASFPGAPGGDTGRGSPYGPGARDLLRFARELGFNGVQLGPQGETSPDNPSPYDGTVFAKSALSISLAELASEPRWGGILPVRALADAVQARPGDGRHVPYAWARATHARLLDLAWAAFRDARRAGTPVGARLGAALERFRAAHGAWLERDGLFAVLAALHGGEDWTAWTGPDGSTLDRRLFAPHAGEEGAARARVQEVRERHRDAIERFAFFQMVLDEQHHALRDFAGGLGMRLFGDLQIGFAHRDRWSYGALFLRDYVMGAPPSRTNPDGQGWGYPVLDPDLYHARRDGDVQRGAVLDMVGARMARMLSDFDGVRIDHPHGLVCPWVYRADDERPDAVREGARLFASPDLPDHPGLARFAIVRPDQLDRGVARWADGWVGGLEAEQVERYDVLFEEVVLAARNAGRDTGDLVAEVLSTCPYPLLRVLERHGLGRFRVTQKVTLSDPHDVYRPEAAAAPDWVMLGNHDTPPIWVVLRRWQDAGEIAARADDVASRLAADRPRDFARGLVERPERLAQAMLADLFASRARNVQVFFADLLGLDELFNRPGVASADNWTLRVPPDYRDEYRERVARDAALDVPGALALAIRARRGRSGTAHDDLLALLDARSAALRAGGRGATPPAAACP